MSAEVWDDDFSAQGCSFKWYHGYEQELHSIGDCGYKRRNIVVWPSFTSRKVRGMNSFNHEMWLWDLLSDNLFVEVDVTRR